MIRRFLFTLSTLVFLFASADCCAQVFPVEQFETPLGVSSEPTMTFLWESRNPRATLIFIPGGEGSVGVRPDWTGKSPYFSRYHFSQMLKRLSDPGSTAGSLNVVIFDSPYRLEDGGYPASRTTRDHMVRIESTVLFYRQKLGKPVWVMGHSNGGFSIAEFYKHLQKKNRESIVDGLIFSAGRDASSFNDRANTPILFMISEKDDCIHTTPEGNRRLYDRMKKVNLSETGFAFIRNTRPEQKTACGSGHHMYLGAAGEVAQTIESFVLGRLPKGDARGRE